MDIVVDMATQAPSVTLQNPDDFKSFRVVARNGTDPEALARGLEPYGRLHDDGDALISQEGLRGLAGDRAKNEEWRRNLDDMLDYAQSKGWIEAETGAIRAHCDWE